MHLGGKNKQLCRAVQFINTQDLRDDIGCPLHSCWIHWDLGAPGGSASLLAANRLFFHWVVQGLVSGSNSSSFALPYFQVYLWLCDSVYSIL